mmetsp:Transcript_17468/g.35023  ORF Transcript_17468/g.35023 Transcript_17468/m.35023 type:complete len:270 (+) Transcript_17468:553-1362(+)
MALKIWLALRRANDGRSSPASMRSGSFRSRLHSSIAPCHGWSPSILQSSSRIPSCFTSKITLANAPIRSCASCACFASAERSLSAANLYRSLSLSLTAFTETAPFSSGSVTEFCMIRRRPWRALRRNSAELLTSAWRMRGGRAPPMTSFSCNESSSASSDSASAAWRCAREGLTGGGSERRRREWNVLQLASALMVSSSIAVRRSGFLAMRASASATKNLTSRDCPSFTTSWLRRRTPPSWMILFWYSSFSARFAIAWHAFWRSSELLE